MDWLLDEVTVLRVVGTIGAGLAVAAAVVFSTRFMGAQWRRDELYYDGRLRSLFVHSLTGRRLALLVYVAVLIVCLITFGFTRSVSLAVLSAALAAVAPRLLLPAMIRRRIDRLEWQLIEGLLSLANNLRSGMALSQSLARLATSTSGPLAEELGVVMREYDLGKSLPEAMAEFERRVPSHTVQLVVLSIEVCREQGGNLPDVLDRVSGDLRDIRHMMDKVRSITAEGRLQAKAMAASPFILGGLMYLAEPELQKVFYSSFAGKCVLVIAFLLTVVGFLGIRKVVQIDI